MALTVQLLMEQYGLSKEKAQEIVDGQTGVKQVKITDRGMVSVYLSTQRFPVTLWPAQWRTLFAAADSKILPKCEAAES